MKFQWYVIDTDEKTIKGTNDVEKIMPLVNDDRYMLLTAQHGSFFNGSNAPEDVEEYMSDSDDDDEEDSDEDDDVPY